MVTVLAAIGCFIVAALAGLPIAILMGKVMAHADKREGVGG